MKSRTGSEQGHRMIYDPTMEPKKQTAKNCMSLFLAGKSKKKKRK